MKKSLTKVLSLLGLSLVMFAGCNSTADHDHTFSEEWSHNELIHWHAATCEHTDMKKDVDIHAWNEGTVKVEATEVTAGEMEYECTVCKRKKTESIAATGHVYSTEWSGNSDYHWHAATCGHSVEPKDKGSHTWDEGEITTEPTCKSEGEKTLTCIVCSKTKKESVPKSTVHTEDSGRVSKAPTCMNKGVRTYKCSVCDNERNEDIPALGMCESPVDAKTFTAASQSSTYVYFGVFPRSVLLENSILVQS